MQRAFEDHFQSVHSASAAVEVHTSRYVGVYVCVCVCVCVLGLGNNCESMIIIPLE